MMKFKGLPREIRWRQILTRGICLALFLVGGGLTMAVLAWLCLMMVVLMLPSPDPFPFPRPEDACLISNQPRILNQDTKNQTQTYQRRDGATVRVTYFYNPFTGTITLGDTETWFGGTCEPDGEVGNG